MLNPDDPPEVQIRKQAKIIDALIRRSNRQRDVGPSAFQAFQSALSLQQKVQDQTRDLERVSTELESARYERERTRRNLVEALSSMDEGIALFTGGKLDLCNSLFRDLLPDIAGRVKPGLLLDTFLTIMSQSAHVVSTDRPLRHLLRVLTAEAALAGREHSVWLAVIELSEDRWYQLSAQHTSDDSLVILLTEITSLVRRNRDEKEALIDQQADYLGAVFQNMTPGVCTFTELGDVIMHNRRFREMLGLPQDMVEPGTPMAQVLGFMQDMGFMDSEQKEVTAAWADELKTRGRLRRRVWKSNDLVLDIQANRLPDQGYLIELKDVTLEARTTQLLENRVMARTAELTRANDKLVREYEEKARVEEELRLAKERAEAAVSSKTRFLAAASHDLLQPINAAKLLISTLLETTRHTESFAMVQRLEGAFGSAEQLLHSLLDISRLESPDPDAVTPTHVSLGPILEGVHTDQTLVAEEKGVRLDMVPCSAFVRSDPVYLLRSVQNLVVNAIQYTNPGGRVLFGCRQRGDRIVFEVWDTGIGIKQADQARIFEEFARADDVPVGSGMGLGLSVVDRACRLLGHSLTVHSTPGRGSTFRIEMERLAPREQVAEVTGLRGDVDDLRLEHIVMVIENDAGVRHGMTGWLEQWGASVLAAANIAEALEYCADMGMAPDIILADYQLDDGETGVEAIAQIRAFSARHVPAILITANRSQAVWLAADENDILVMTKPAKLNRLRAMIDWKIRQAKEGLVGPGFWMDPAMQTKVGGD